MVTLKSELNYRKATARDSDKLMSLGIESYSEFSTVLTRANWQKMNAFLENKDSLNLLIKQSIAFVCETETTIVGMIYLVPSGNPTQLFEENWSYIRFLGVNPDYRGNGIGKNLTNLCIEYAKETNENHIALHTSEFMDAARTIYENLGFEKTKEIKHFGKKYWVYLLDLTK